MRSLKLDFATAPAPLIEAVRATAEERGITTSRAIQDALTAYLGRPVGPTADTVIEALSRAGVASPAVERAVRGVWERGTTKKGAKAR